MKISNFIHLSFFAFITCAQGQNIQLKPENLVPYDVIIKQEKYKGNDAVILVQTRVIDNQKTFALLKDIDFHNGTIELSLAGDVGNKAVEGARGFVGVVFRVNKDTSKFEHLYIRPLNGRANDQVRRNHSVQYVSYPGFPWEKTRKETPEKYESYADLIPGEWTKIKIEVKDETAKLFVNGVEQPNLIVNDLKLEKEQRGAIGLWIGPGTIAQFADLKVTKLD